MIRFEPSHRERLYTPDLCPRFSVFFQRTIRWKFYSRYLFLPFVLLDHCVYIKSHWERQWKGLGLGFLRIGVCQAKEQSVCLLLPLLRGLCQMLRLGLLVILGYLGGMALLRACWRASAVLFACASPTSASLCSLRMRSSWFFLHSLPPSWTSNCVSNRKQSWVINVRQIFLEHWDGER